MQNEIEFEWDEAKNAANQAKHKCHFEAARAFDFSTALVVEDKRRDYDETRMIAVGYIGARLHVLVFTIRVLRIRVISLRKANKRERAHYEKVD